MQGEMMPHAQSMLFTAFCVITFWFCKSCEQIYLVLSWFQYGISTSIKGPSEFEQYLSSVSVSTQF